MSIQQYYTECYGNVHWRQSKAQIQYQISD